MHRLLFGSVTASPPLAGWRHITGAPMKPELGCDSLRIPLQPGMHLQRSGRKDRPLFEGMVPALGVTAC
ncbi:hypothetical protein KOM00_03425 [Geomonas sp. Red69]|uniref:hypothetical protein n=1 Tax=Geomonas diazotrophica TaxID=2843197 RepID=UPI001C103504|nr:MULTISPECIES: hypothetical protein [Geomonas]MBU5635775.1 hypothetical protein [Geomonas diazotrophica]QXE87122.1 hypothetical protein KP003_01555 [Geomonas nitrogeniifigens]